MVLEGTIERNTRVLLLKCGFKCYNLIVSGNWTSVTESSLACTFKLWNSEANERLREYLRCWHNQQHLNIVLTWEMSLCVCVIDLYVASVTEVFFIYRKKKDKLIVGHKCLMVHHTNVCGAITEICGRAKMIRPSHPYVTVPIQRLSSRVISFMALLKPSYQDSL